MCETLAYCLFLRPNLGVPKSGRAFSIPSLNLIISGVHQSHLGCWGHRSAKVKLRGLDDVACKMCQCAVLLKDKIIIRNVFGSY